MVWFEWKTSFFWLTYGLLRVTWNAWCIAVVTNCLFRKILDGLGCSNVSETIVDVSEKIKNNEIFALSFSPWCVVPSPAALPTAVVSFHGVMVCWFVALDGITVLSMTQDCLSKLLASNSARKFDFVSENTQRITRTTKNDRNASTDSSLVCAGVYVSMITDKLMCLFFLTRTTIHCSTS